MDLTTLLETHTVGHRCKSDGFDDEVLLNQTYDLDEYIKVGLTVNDHVHFCSLFSFAEFPLSPVSNTVLFQQSLYYNSVVHFNALGNTTELYCQLRVHSTTSTTSIKVYFALCDAHYSGIVEVLPNITYMISHDFQYDSGGSRIIWNVCLLALDEYGVATAVDNSDYSGSIYGNYWTIHNAAFWWYQQLKFNGYVFEPDLAMIDATNGYGSVPAHRIFGCVDRALVTSYNEPDYCKNYVFPPAPAFDGSAYDRSNVLESEIEDIQDVVDALTADLITAQTDLDTLTSRLSTQLVTYVNTCFATITSWITGIDVEILKIAAAFGSEGKFTLATLNAALTDIINAGFDAIEAAM